MTTTKQANSGANEPALAFRACAMQWLVAFAVATCGALPAAAAVPAAPLAPPVAISPLPAMRLTGGYGETRSNHFHAGLDLSTGGVVGAAVRAPLAGSVERVRTSGIGYGRSLYLRARDGRLVVFGHLDAFARPLAAWVDSVQVATGRYEQDLWPPVARFAFAAGDTVAYSGASGAGPPHLHVEIRHGDFALSPLRAGLTVADAGVPRIERLVLEPISADARVRGLASPAVLAPSARAETLVAVGTLRAVVRTRSGLAGAGDVPAWSTAVTWEGARTEARLDSISWAGEMSQLDWLVDRGRVAGSEGFILYSPAVERPRFLRTDAPFTEPAGEIRVEPGAPPRPLQVEATDVNGASRTWTVWLRGPRADETAPALRAAVAAGKGAAAAKGEPVWEFFPVPGGELTRVRVSNVPADLRAARIERPRDADSGAVATFDGAAWSALVRTASVPDDEGLWFKAVRADSSTWWRRCDAMLWRTGVDLLYAPAQFAQLSLTRDVIWERGLAVTRVRPASGGAGLVALTPVLQVLPYRLPLRKDAPIALRPGERDSIACVGLYRRAPGGTWEYVRGQSWDATARLFRAETATLGEFALLRDVSPPVVRTVRPPRRALPGAYSRWALAARVSEAGSGVDAAESRFVVDGRAVPSEWDPDADELRWRPLVPPASGTHTYEVIVRDRAGLRARATGTFVLDSAAR